MNEVIVICDIDGVLADIRGFHHILPDWEEYYKHILEFPTIPEVVMLVDSLILGGHRVVFLTGRPLSTNPDTLLWLTRSVPNLDTIEVKMRQEGDFRPTIDIKLEVIRELRPSLVIEDEPKAVKVLKDEGFTVLQVHGYRATEEDYVPYLGSLDM